MARHSEPIAETYAATSSRQPHCQPFDPSCWISGGADENEFGFQQRDRGFQERIELVDTWK